MKKSTKTAVTAFAVTLSLLVGLWAFTLADLNARQSSILNQPPAFGIEHTQEQTVRVTVLGRDQELDGSGLNRILPLLRSWDILLPRGLRLAVLGGKALGDSAVEYAAQQREQAFVETLLQEGF